MKYISVVSKKYGNKIAICDNKDFEYLNSFKWSLKMQHGIFYPRCNINIDGKRTTKYMHKLLLPDGIVDHINGNGLDNRKENLRYCTYGENARNRKIKSNNSSKYKGVSFDKTPKLKNKWRAKITKDYKQMNIGWFSTEKEAAIAYNELALKLFGDFARINNIED